VHEHIARAMYCFSVHLLYASIVGCATWGLTSRRKRHREILDLGSDYVQFHRADRRGNVIAAGVFQPIAHTACCFVLKR
jgi:hypothetical protein